MQGGFFRPGLCNHSPMSLKTLRPVTLRQVAEQAGVHVSTVSRALDPERRHLIGQEAMTRIEAAVRQLGFRPNQAASTLRRGRTMAIGVLIPDLTNQVSAKITQGVESALVERGYFPLVVSMRAAASGKAVAERLISQRVEGVVVATAPRDDLIVKILLQAGIPAVLVNRTDPSGHLSSVTGDSRYAMAVSIGHLYELGHRRIALLAGPQTLHTAMDRLEGARRALQEHKLKPWGVGECEAYSREAGHRVCAKLIESAGKARGRAAAKPMFTALCAANDLLALGAYGALREAGLSIPDDVSVIGQNDIMLTDMVSPPLTTLNGRHVELGYEAARLLIDSIEGGAAHERPAPAPQSILFRGELIVRGSTAPPRAMLVN
jgi:LacI family transcriptional regulator